MSAKRIYMWAGMILAGALAGAVPGTLTASPVTYTYTGLPFQFASYPAAGLVTIGSVAGNCGDITMSLALASVGRRGTQWAWPGSRTAEFA